MKRILIAGPGRSGTSILVRIISELGYSSTADEGRWYESARAGFEATYDRSSSPLVVKDPRLTQSLPKMLSGGTVTADDIHIVLVPFRDLDLAAASRWEITHLAKRAEMAGGLWGTHRPTKQAGFLARGLWSLLLALEDHDVPYRLMHYPRFMFDAAYFREAIHAAFPDADLDEAEVIWARLRDPELLRSEIPGRRPNLLDDLRSQIWSLLGQFRRRVTWPVKTGSQEGAR
jgi:hypothetical protein